MEDDWDRRIDRRFEELKNLLMELAAQKGLTIAPRTGPIQSSEGNSAGEPDDRTLLVKIHSMEYRISCEVLELVFSRFGILEDVEILDSGSEFHSRIRFRDRDSAIKALEYDGKDIYDGCCRLELFLCAGRSSRSIDIEAPIEDASSDRLNEIEAPIEDAKQVEEVKTVDQKLEQLVDSLQEGTEQAQKLGTKIRDGNEASDSIIDSCEVISNSFESIVPSVASDEMGRSFDDLVDISLRDFQLNSIELSETSENSVAHEVFNEMPNRNSSGIGDFVQVSSAQLLMGDCVFDPGIVENWNYRSDDLRKQVVKQASQWEECDLNLILWCHCNGSKLMPSFEYDSWIVDLRVRDIISVLDPRIVCHDRISELLSKLDPRDRNLPHLHNGSMGSLVISIFDPGIAYKTEIARRFVVQNCGDRLHDFGESTAGTILVFDPGGVFHQDVFAAPKELLPSYVHDHPILFKLNKSPGSTCAIFEVLHMLLAIVDHGLVFPFDPGGRCLHQRGCLVLDGRCTEGLQLIRSIWLIAWSWLLASMFGSTLGCYCRILKDG